MVVTCQVRERKEGGKAVRQQNTESIVSLVRQSHSMYMLQSLLNSLARGCENTMSVLTGEMNCKRILIL